MISTRTHNIDTERKAVNWEKKIRTSLFSFLNDYMDYCLIPQGVKRSKTVKWGDKKNRLSEYPLEESFINNVIGIPKNNLVVFDIDRKEGALDVNSQRKLLFEYLGIKDITETIVKVSPSGGQHVYVVWSKNVTPPKPTVDSLKRIDARLTGDIRSSRSNSYVLLHGSFLKGDYVNPYYTAINGTTPYVLGEDKSLELGFLLDSSEPKASDRYEKKILFANGDSIKSKVDMVNKNYNKSRIGVDLDTIKRVEGSLKVLGMTNYHPQRAWVKRALSCHYSDYDIIDVWEKLGLDYDSNGGKPRKMGFDELIKDAARLDASLFCGSVCRRRLEKHNKDAHIADRGSGRLQLPLEEAVKRALYKESRPSSFKDYRVLNKLKTTEAIMAGRRAKSKDLAVRIVNEIISFHMLAGRQQILLGYDFLTQRYGVKRPEIAKALNHIKKAGVIYVYKKQAKGKLPSYKVNAAFVEKRATKLLRAAIAENNKRIGNEGVWALSDNLVDWTTGEIQVVDTASGEMITIVCNELKRKFEVFKNKFPCCDC